uniref:HECT domain-containing protein n=1 Tax=Macrostomum lignano TaxID=282301 RepID=A0A1I8FD33_9PLAT
LPPALKDALNAAVENLSDLDAETFHVPFLEVITRHKATHGPRHGPGRHVHQINSAERYELITNESTPSLTGVIEMIGVALKDDLLTQQKLKRQDGSSSSSRKSSQQNSASSNPSPMLTVRASASAANCRAHSLEKKKRRQETQPSAAQQVPASDQLRSRRCQRWRASAAASCPQLTRARAAEEAAEFSATLAASFARPAGQDQVDAAEESIVAAPEAFSKRGCCRATRCYSTIVETEAERRRRKAEAEESGVLQPLLAEKSESSQAINRLRIMLILKGSDLPQSRQTRGNGRSAVRGRLQRRRRCCWPPASSTLRRGEHQAAAGGRTRAAEACARIFKQLIANMNARTIGAIRTPRKWRRVFESLPADSLEKCDCLLELVRSDLCKESGVSGTSVFAASLRLGYLIFSSLRWHLKFQLEAIVTSEGSRGVRLTTASWLWNRCTALAVPAFRCREVYLNYDCDLLLLQPVQGHHRGCCPRTPSAPAAALFSHALVSSLDALLTVIDLHREAHCNAAAAVSATKAAASQKQPQPASCVQLRPLRAAPASTNIGDVIGDDVTKHRCLGGLLRRQGAGAPARAQRSCCNKGAELFNRNPAKGAGVSWRTQAAVPQLSESVPPSCGRNPSLDKKVLTRRVPISQQKNAGGQFSAQPSAAASTSPADELTRRLRDYLETFRLPACAREHFADHTGTAPTRHPFATKRRTPLAYSCWLIPRSSCAAGSTRAGQLHSREPAAVGAGWTWDLFTNLIWGPPWPALCRHVFDRQRDEAIVVPKARYRGFRKSTSSSRGGPIRGAGPPVAARRRMHSRRMPAGAAGSVDRSKFLRMDSLRRISKGSDLWPCRTNYQYQGPAVRRAQLRCSGRGRLRVIYFELLMQVLLQNRDRLGPLLVIRAELLSTMWFSCLRPLLNPGQGRPNPARRSAGGLYGWHGTHQHARHASVPANGLAHSCSLCWRFLWRWGGLPSSRLPAEVGLQPCQRAFGPSAFSSSRIGVK